MAEHVTGEQLGRLYRRQNELYRRVKDGTIPCNQAMNSLQGIIEDRIPHIIDCDADPYIPEGFSVSEHEKKGKLIWDQGNIKLLDTLEVEGEESVEDLGGYDLYILLRKENSLNANVLDYLLQNPYLIPKEWWEEECIYFWGTLYHNKQGCLCVRYLSLDEDKPFWNDCDWIFDDWNSLIPIPVLS